MIVIIPYASTDIESIICFICLPAAPVADGAWCQLMSWKSISRLMHDFILSMKQVRFHMQLGTLAC